MGAYLLLLLLSVCSKCLDGPRSQFHSRFEPEREKKETDKWIDRHCPSLGDEEMAFAFAFLLSLACNFSSLLGFSFYSASSSFPLLSPPFRDQGKLLFVLLLFAFPSHLCSVLLQALCLASLFVQVLNLSSLPPRSSSSVSALPSVCLPSGSSCRFAACVSSPPCALYSLAEYVQE